MRTGLTVGVGVGLGTRSDAGGTAAATLNTGDLSAPVLTSGTRWTATLTWQEPGSAGNAGVLSLSFLDADPASVEVRDGELHNGTAWEPAPDTIGCLVISSPGIDDLSIGELESAINAGSSLAQVTTPDPSPANTVSADMDTIVTQGSFSGGVG